MTLLNRGFAHVRPTQLWMDWALANANETPFFTSTPEATLYLIEEDFWEEEDLIKKYYKKIFNQECITVCDDETLWPKLSNHEDFLQYFEMEFGTFVYDLLKTDLIAEEV